MMQPRHWLDQLPAWNRSGLRELMGRLAQRQSGRPQIEIQPKVGPRVRRARAVSARKLSVPRAHPLGKMGLFSFQD